jgi:hypothetical protein
MVQPVIINSKKKIALLAIENKKAPNMLEAF